MQSEEVRATKNNGRGMKCEEKEARMKEEVGTGKET